VGVKKMMIAVAGVLVLTACGNATEQAANVRDVAATTAAPVTTTIAPPPAPTTTEAPTTTTATSSTSTSTKKSTSAKKSTTTKKTTTKKAPAGVSCAAGVEACVDLSARKAWLIEDGEVVYGPVQIMPGMPSNPTPVGTFSVTSKVRNYHSREFDAPMPNSVFFQPGIAFHEGSLSKYSHGCIHLSSGVSAKFFSTLSAGDTVQVVR
jgi:lipoprotein-anchoring transpeptidase ErfK/SrfK